ncbi:hypothetical protein MBM_04909 [Drepanopeziza brunnea f. sp. 'multigermtubi' MB_m1]|uniref:Uncharacterized protein n=1 Tax=Marssonina brunnea f. sp. multigermtubi (strain MB_m1) TaxID=1072389 RepID=K1WXQ0_MARBU|nr:uncharacterized protein MBM_04909 [Drepanopeziza brunnea f. sp. 'multigermtubi' MB_m1]EKD17332.1 hypothetical protein MBM_04909 [Drepanopeziza brunnea f. sp. 'multigermtubi' MB_m1]
MLLSNKVLGSSCSVFRLSTRRLSERTHGEEKTLVAKASQVRTWSVKSGSPLFTLLIFFASLQNAARGGVKAAGPKEVGAKFRLRIPVSPFSGSDPAEEEEEEEEGGEGEGEGEEK